jgi:peroxiredoxin
MPALQPPAVDLQFSAPDFDLPGVDGRRLTLKGVRGTNGLLVMFICNHCPYVKAIIDRLVCDTRELAAHGVNSVAIMSNDTVNYPEDSLDNMRRLAQEKNFPFPYLYDETQDVALAYGAICTPDFFGFNRDLKLRFRGRLDASRTTPMPDARRELLDGMLHVGRTGEAPADQIPSMGCSIKWRT